MRWHRQISFPGTRQIGSDIFCSPKLEISQGHQPPPMFFMLVVGCLELVEQKFLFAKAKEMLQIVALQVSFINVEQR
jgi:hypothetical protein